MGRTPVCSGRLLLAVCQAGETVVRRRAQNIVLERGAHLLASLFAGADGTGPIDRMGVGFAQEAADVTTTGLKAPDDPDIPAAALSSAVEADDFTIATDPDARLVRVTVAALFKPSTELKGVTEAGLFAGERLYNQVVFEPVTLHPGQDVTLFWEIDFPFGH